MVKVTGQYNLDLHKTTCRGCNSMLEYTSKEVKQGQRYSMDSRFENDLVDCKWVDCPVCKVKVWV